jgi:hypothetical protein
MMLHPQASAVVGSEQVVIVHLPGMFTLYMACLPCTA